MSGTTNFASGAVRSSDANHMSMMSSPMLGFMMVAATSKEGGTKYGKYNYMKGMPVDDLLEHVLQHIFSYACGDRSEQHLAHAAWGMLTAVQSSILDPELSEARLLGPGMTLPEAMLAEMERMKPILTAQRAAGEFDHVADWDEHDIPQIRKILEQRRDVKAAKSVSEQAKEDAEYDADEATYRQGFAEPELGPPDRSGFQRFDRACKADIVAVDEPVDLGFAGDLIDSNEGTLTGKKVNEAYGRGIDYGTRTVTLTFNGQTKKVPLNIRCNMAKVHDATKYDEILFVGRPEHEYAILSEKYSGKYVLHIDQRTWDEAPDISKESWTKTVNRKCVDLAEDSERRMLLARQNLKSSQESVVPKPDPIRPKTEAYPKPLIYGDVKIKNVPSPRFTSDRFSMSPGNESPGSPD